jgi:hypothetical protein
MRTLIRRGWYTMSVLSTLDEVQMIRKEATTNADLNKKSFNLADNIAQSGGSVLDAMKTMPGVTFDQEGKVVLRGSDKVVVLLYLLN